MFRAANCLLLAFKLKFYCAFTVDATIDFGNNDVVPNFVQNPVFFKKYSSSFNILTKNDILHPGHKFTVITLIFPVTKIIFVLKSFYSRNGYYFVIIFQTFLN